MIFIKKLIVTFSLLQEPWPYNWLQHSLFYKKLDVISGDLREEERCPDGRCLYVVAEDAHEDVGHHAHQNAHGEEHDQEHLQELLPLPGVCDWVVCQQNLDINLPGQFVS